MLTEFVSPHIAGFKKLLRHIGQSQQGNIAVAFGLTLPVLVITLGLVVDYNRATRVDSRIADASDAATLALIAKLSKGEKFSDSQLNQLAREIFMANIDGMGDFTLSNFAVIREPGDKTLSIKVAGTTPASFLSIIGQDEIEVGAAATATYGVQNIELAMMLDVTGSMRSRGKIGALKLAAVDLVDMLMPASGKSETTRIAMVPYSSGVNAGSYARKVTNNLSTKCVVERSGTEEYSDASGIDHPLSYNRRSGCPTSEIVPLTDTSSVLKSKISRLSTTGMTAGHIGVAWAYYTLSPEWNDLFGSRAGSKYGSNDLSKIAVLMTDGEFNQFYTKKGNKGQHSRETTTSLCKQMRSDGIRIYTVAFALNSWKAEKMLETCASTNDDGNPLFFEAKNSTELRQAFRAIAADVTDLRLSK